MHRYAVRVALIGSPRDTAGERRGLRVPVRRGQRLPSIVRALARLAAACSVVALLAAAPAASFAQPSSAPSAATAKPRSSAPAVPERPVAPAPEKPAAESIPVPEVARRADEVGRVLRDLDARIAPEPFIASIEQRLPGITARIATQIEQADRQLVAEPSGAVLDALTAQWQANRAELGGYVNVLAERATALEEAMTRLTTLHESWTRARADARASRAPAQVIDRIDGVLAAIAGARTRAQAQRAATLVSQDYFAQDLARCEAVLERVAAARQQLAGRWLARDSIPLWQTGDLARAAAGLPDQVGEAIRAELAVLRQFAEDQRWKMPLHLALFVGLVLVMRAARRRARVSGGPGEGTLRAFDRPVSEALVLTLLAMPWIYSPPVPRSVVILASVLALGPALRIMRGLLEPSLAPGLYVLGAFFLADLVRHFVSVVPLLERQIFLLEMFAGVIVLGWWLVARRPRRAWSAAGERAVRMAAGALLAGCAAALVAGAAGYMRLALLLGGRVLGSGYLALVLYAGLRVGDGLVAFALRTRPLRQLGIVERHRPLVEQRAHGLLRWVAIAVWLVLALRFLGLWPAAVSLTQTALAADLRWGSFSVSLGDVLVFALTVTAAFLLSGIVRFVLEEDVYPRLDLGRGLPYALSSLLHYFLVGAGFLLALTVLGVDLTKVTILAGALGVGIGFGLQNLVNNFVSGSLLLFERKINVGDAIQIGDVSGQVQQMGMRACTVRTWEGAEVIVPNASLTSDKVTNWTLSDRLRRIDVAVGVAYGTPPETVQELMLAVARGHNLVLKDPPPLGLFLGFGDSALSFEMRVWTDRFDRWLDIRSELNVALYEALRGAGIEIPFPQREVHLRHE
jgi:small-conductance mechanosensitive channel